MYDVDYGFCYTFNYQTPSGIYNTTKFDNMHGLVMIMTLNISEYLQSTEYQGAKIVIHPQDQTSFPNVDGYMGRPGAMIDHVINRVGYLVFYGF